MAKTKKVQTPDESCYNSDMALFINPRSSTFEFFRNGETLYVDKTKWLYKLIRTNDKYLASGKKIHLLGINFSTKERNIDDVIVEVLQG